MKVRVSEHLFSDEAVADAPFLLPSLFQACLDAGHVIVTEFDLEQCPPYLAWRAARTVNERDVVDVVLRTSLQTDARETIDCVVVATASRTDWTTTPPVVGPDELLGLLHAPLTILVENEVNDGAFLRAVPFGIDGDVFRKCLQTGRVRFDHAGGSSMRGLIEQRGRDRVRAHRMWAIFDGDALVPGRPSTEAQAKVAACLTAKVRHHMLARRAIENYGSS